MFGLSRRKKIEQEMKLYFLNDYKDDYSKLDVNIFPFACKYADNNALAVLLYTDKRKYYDTITVNILESSSLNKNTAYVIARPSTITFIEKNNLGVVKNAPVRYSVDTADGKQEVRNFYPVEFDVNKLNTFEQLQDWLNVDKGKLIDLNTNKGV